MDNTFSPYIKFCEMKFLIMRKYCFYMLSKGFVFISKF